MVRSVSARGGMGGGNEKKEAGHARKKGFLYLQDVVLALPAAEAEAGIFKNHAQEKADKAEEQNPAVAAGSFRRRPRKQPYPRRAPFF